METLLMFKLDEVRYACFARAVRRVIWAVEITPLPARYDKVLGVVNVEEVVVPIVDLRKIIGLPARALDIDNDIIVMQSNYGPVGFVADTVEGIAQHAEADFAAITEAIKPYASDILKLDSDLVVIVDPSKLVCADDLPDGEAVRLSGVK